MTAERGDLGDLLKHLHQRATEFGANREDLVQQTIQLVPGLDDDMIEALEELRSMTPEQREQFDRLRAEWKDDRG